MDAPFVFLADDDGNRVGGYGYGAASMPIQPGAASLG